jgi:hypothetical protein
VAGVVRQATKAGVSVWIAGASTPVRKVLEAHGVHAGFASTAADAVATARAAIKIGA